jgi:hypothetical protein
MLILDLAAKDCQGESQLPAGRNARKAVDIHPGME